MGAIGHALVAGELTTATNLLWTSMRVVWSEGVDFIKGLWLAKATEQTVRNTRRIMNNGGAAFA